MALSYSIRPLFDKESCTWTFIIIDTTTKKAALIDSVIEQSERDLKLIDELGLSLEYLIETHVHADHITGASLIKEATGAKIAYGKENNVEGADLDLHDGDILQLGKTAIKAIATPGHTSGCYCFYIEGALFTGDTLFNRGCGRTDFQDGGSAILFDTIHNKLYAYDDDTVVYPGHDYNGMLCSTIGEEKRNNPRLNLSVSKAQFVTIMDGLNLPYPKKIDSAMPANLKAGKNHST